MREKLFAEFLGTAFLVMIVFGSGIMGQTLFPGQLGLALLANSLATGAGLFVLIQSLGPVSGAHLNPAVSLVEFLWKRLDRAHVLPYVATQLAGAYAGVLLTHLMFDLPVFVLSTVSRPGTHLLVSEVVATFGLIAVIALSGKKHVEFAPLSVAAYVTAGYWFTSSTCFVNPAVTFARGFTESFGGAALADFGKFFLGQIAGAILGAFAFLPRRTLR
jgi:glycerol uptake facilitator-like aquaporin